MTEAFTLICDTGQCIAYEGKNTYTYDIAAGVKSQRLQDKAMVTDSAHYTMGTNLFQEVKRPRRGVDRPPPSSAEVKETVEV